MAKKAVPVEKHQLKSKEILALIARWQVLESEIAPLDEELKGIKDKLVADMDPKEAHEFRDVTLRCIQGKTRKGLQWKVIAFGLAKRLYPDTVSLRRWMRDLARKFPYVSSKPYVKLFTAKEEE